MNTIKTIFLSTLLSTVFIIPVSAATSCFNEEKLVTIAKELDAAFQEDFCAKGIKPLHLQWISQTALPQIMNKSFLGVEPPPDWQLLSAELMRDCFKEGDLCTNETQKQVVACLQVKLPTILMELGPWVAENCKKINDTVIEQWPDKKEQVFNLITQFQTQSQRE